VGVEIKVDGLTKSFGRDLIWKDVSLTIPAGEICVMLGPSGTGKSVFLKTIIGLLKPDTGSIVIEGLDIANCSERDLYEIRKLFGVLFQDGAMFGSMSLYDNVAFPLREHTKLREKEIRRKVIDKLRALNLENIERRAPSELSGGMRKRVALARALMLEPEIVMYDEPTSGLDPISCRLVDDLILETRDRFGVTSVVISHDMAGALRIADYIFVLSKGRMVDRGSPRELVERGGELTREFFDSSGIAAERLLQEHEEAAVRYRR
jgi:phospholipid/cholesterol/gamma-HCH transport system ATP-binding protein